MNFRRHYIEGATIFITQVVAGRRPLLASEANVVLLRETLHAVKHHHPFRMLGYVFLPDHFHLVIAPTGSSNFSQIMHSLKRNFTVAYKVQNGIARQTPYRCWQPRFWEHRIRNDEDLEQHMDYVHYNPVKHGYVARVGEWENSSFHYWQARGYYESDWGGVEPAELAAMSLPTGE